MKRRLPGIVLVLAIAALAVWTAACGSELPGNAVAKVGDTYITADQFNAAVAQQATDYGITRDQYPELYKELEKWVVENLVANEVAAQEAPKLGLSVTDEEVQTQVDNYLNAYYSGDQATMEASLETAGLTMDDFKKNVKDGLLREKVQTEVVKDVTSVPEEKIKAKYYANQDSFYIEPSRGLRHILIKPEANGAATDANWAKALATAKDVRRGLAAGGDWTSLAAQYSGDFATKDKGGDLGTVYEGETIKEFEEAAFALELNELSQPVKTVYGYELIQATAVIKGGVQTLDEVRSQIESELLAEAQDAVWNKWLEEKQAAADVIYRSDLKPAPTTTTTESATTTTELGGPTTTASSATTTTAKP